MEKEYSLSSNVSVTAIQWTGQNWTEVQSFTSGHCYISSDNYWNVKLDNRLYKDFMIHTPEGETKVSVGDYIVKGITSGWGVCSKEIFEALFVEVWDDKG